MYIYRGMRGLGDELSHESSHAVQVFMPGSSPVAPVVPTLPTVPPSPLTYPVALPWYQQKILGIVPVWLLLVGGAGLVGYKLYKR